MNQRRIRSITDLGAAIRDSRIQHGLTQAELARRAGVSREWIVGIEQGSRPRAELSRLLAVLRTLDEPLCVGAPSHDKPENSGSQASARGHRPVTDEATRTAISAIRASTLRGVDPELFKRVADTMGSALSPSSDVMRRALLSMRGRTPDSEDDR